MTRLAVRSNPGLHTAQLGGVMNTAPTSRDTALALWQGWVGLWNGDLPQAKQILATGFTVNAALVGVDGAVVQGAPGVAGWVALLRKALGEPVFTVEVG